MRKPYIEPVPKMPNPIISSEEDKHFSMAPVCLVSEDNQQVDDEVKSMMEASENTTTTGNQTRRVFTCKVCGKEGTWTNIKTHIEANHIISNVIHSCDICGKSSRSRHGLRLHKAKEHSKQ